MGERGDNEYSVQLYRAVSQEELDDIELFNGFRPGSGCMETKLFATSAAESSAIARGSPHPGSTLAANFILFHASLPKTHRLSSRMRKKGVVKESSCA